VFPFEKLFEVLFPYARLEVAKTYDLAEIAEIETSSDAAFRSARVPESSMIAVNTGIDDRPGNLTAIHAEEGPRGISLDGWYRSCKGWCRAAIERNLPDRGGPILRVCQYLRKQIT
jgi:hypothetical protein